VTDALYLIPELAAQPAAGDGRPPDAAVDIVLTGDEARHAAVVKRLAVGESVLLGNGRGLLVRARAVEVGHGCVRLRELSRRFDPQPDPRFVMVQALPKGDRADLAVEVMTELGADVIVPWAAVRSVSQWRGTDKQDRALAKWVRTGIEASKQCRRSRFPEVRALHSTVQVAQLLTSAALALVLYEDAVDRLAASVTQVNGLSGDVVVVVGPEGGLDPEELAAFRSAGARPVRMGAEVLRTSTAGAAALAVLSVATGRWN
jgi:16S rRNA (uracil1498-N3)-methyltransferase